MTVPTEARADRYPGTGAQSDFDINFYVQNAADIEVRAILNSTGASTTLTKDTDYTVASTLDEITLIGNYANIASTYTVVILLKPDLNSDSAFRNRSSLNLGDVEDALDYASQRTLRQQDEIDRSLKLPFSETPSEAKTTIPSVTARASKALGFDANGNPTAMTVTSVGAPLDAAYVTVGNAGDLSAERALTGTSNEIVITDGGANGAVTVSVSSTFTKPAATPTFAGLTLTQAVSTSGSPTCATITGAAHTTLAASTEATDCNVNLARTVQFATGALVTQRAVRIQAPTYAFVGASTITDAATLHISGAPAAGTNATITNAYALWVDGGAVRIDGNLCIGSSAVALSFSTNLILGSAAALQFNTNSTSRLVVNTSGFFNYAASSGVGYQETNPAELTGDVNDYNPGTGVVFRLSSDASRNITGLAGGSGGRMIAIANIGAQNIVLQNANTGSAEANRILTGTGADVTLGADDVVWLFYDSYTQRWRLFKNA